MTLGKSQQAEIQFDYFSDNFKAFEEDFYTYSRLEVPLTFLIDDILWTMAAGQTSYFKLNAQNALDQRDHYFIFQVRSQEEAKMVRTYQYLGHTLNHPTDTTYF